MSADDDSESFPQSIRHRQILDVAAENPDASLDELASLVPSATPDLVERVLDEYGDPAADAQSTDSNGSMPDQTDSTDGSNAEPTADDTGSDDADDLPSLEDLSEKHRELVALVAAHPEATQDQLADHFDVTRATVSRWASDVEGFEWTDRESFAEAVVDEPPAVELQDGSTEKTEATHSDATATTGSDATESESADGDGGSAADLGADIEHLEKRVTALEDASESAQASGESAFEDPELVHKVVHACMESDRISESEELRILQELLE